MRRIILAAAAAWLAVGLSACGGGQEASDQPPPMSTARVAAAHCDGSAAGAVHRQVGTLCLRSGSELRRAASAGPAHRAEASTGPFTSDELLDWAEATYPTLFPAAERRTGKIGDLVSFRHYPRTQNHLAISLETGEPAVYLYGAATNWQVLYQGLVAEFACAVRGGSACQTTQSKKLLLSEVGVALASTPAWTRLQRTLTLSSSGATGVAWTAKSDRPWLIVTPSGNTGSVGSSTITLQANVASLANDTTDVATVTFSTTANGVTVPEKLVVGVWKGSSTPTQVQMFQKRYQAIVADPVRPLVYVHGGGSTIDVYHLYQQRLEASIPDAGGVLGGMTVAPDGSRLYALDLANRAVVSVHLATRTVEPPLPLVQAASTFAGLGHARPSGVGLLIVGNRAVYTLSPWANLVRGSEGNDEVLYTGRSVSTTLDGSKVALTGRDAASVYSLRIDGSVFSMDLIGRAGLPNGSQASFSRDGSRLYTSSGSPYRCEIWDTLDMSLFGALPADAYPVATRVGSDGRLYCGTNNDKADVWIFSPQGSLQRTLKFVTGVAANLAERGLVVSGDGLMLAAIPYFYYDSDSGIYLVPVGP